MSLPSTISDRRVCILGLGYVGLTLAVAMADSGFHVHGLEVRESVLDQLREGRSHFWEPRLNEKLQRVCESGAFTFSSELDESTDVSVYIITVGTPLGAGGKANIDAIEKAATQMASHLKDGSLVILRSTVKLGTARNVVRPILERSGKEFDLAVCPERTLEGRALIELQELPQIIGADDPETRFRCAQLFGVMTPTTVQVSTLETAELVKLTDNTYRDVTFAFANEIAKLCGHAGISAREVIRAGRLGYPRTNVALPGPVGGPCLEKDPHILVESARQWDVDMAVTRSARLTNEAQPAEVARFIAELAAENEGFSEHPRITIAGLAFKGVPPTDDLRGTMALPVLTALRERFPGASFQGFDPVVDTDATKAFFDISPAESLEEAFRDADVVVLANNHPDLSSMDLAAMASLMKQPGIVYDMWNMHDDVDASMPDGVQCVALGSEREGQQRV